MKILHSFWSAPALSTTTDKSFGGWRHIKYYLESWALSCLSFLKYYDNVELYTDSFGYHILIDVLKLPYTNVYKSLNNLDRFPSHLWALGKIYTYAQQNEPFIHVDNDVFIWDRLKLNEKAPLIGQHVDYFEKHYEISWNTLLQNNYKIPKEMLRDRFSNGSFNSTNAGILGGSNTAFFKLYAEKVFLFINENLKRSRRELSGADYAIIYEQYLFSCLARANNIDVEHLFSYKEFQHFDLSNFRNKFSDKPYVHLIHKTKTYFEKCREMEIELMSQFPKYYTKICQYMSNK